MECLCLNVEYQIVHMALKCIQCIFLLHSNISYTEINCPDTSKITNDSMLHVLTSTADILHSKSKSLPFLSARLVSSYHPLLFTSRFPSHVHGFSLWLPDNVVVSSRVKACQWHFHISACGFPGLSSVLQLEPVHSSHGYRSWVTNLTFIFFSFFFFHDICYVHCNRLNVSSFSQPMLLTNDK